HWWATKTRYPPYIELLGPATKTRYPPYNSLVGNKNTLPTLQFIGGQQKHVTHPTIYWWATKTRYPPYNSLVGNKNTLPTLHKSLIYGLNHAAH
ncbi:MAG: hypothetical protein DRR00_31395, partial [Candidatus Parabeggiatoa sp. nov. 3]